MTSNTSNLSARTRAKGRVLALPAVTDRIVSFGFLMADRDPEAAPRILELKGQIVADDLPRFLAQAVRIVAPALKNTMYWKELEREVSPEIATIITLRIRPLLCLVRMPTEQMLCDAAGGQLLVSRTPMTFCTIVGPVPSVQPAPLAKWIRSWRARSGLIPVRS